MNLLFSLDNKNVYFFLYLFHIAIKKWIWYAWVLLRPRMLNITFLSFQLSKCFVKFWNWKWLDTHSTFSMYCFTVEIFPSNKWFPVKNNRLLKEDPFLLILIHFSCFINSHISWTTATQECVNIVIFLLVLIIIIIMIITMTKKEWKKKTIKAL